MPEASGTGLKNDPWVIEHALAAACVFLAFVKEVAVTEEQIADYINERWELFSCRLLERRTTSDEPNRRSVYDVSFVCNIIFGMFSLPFKRWVSSTTNQSRLTDMDPLTYASLLASSIPVERTPCDADISKCDKRLHFYRHRRYCTELVNCFDCSWA